MPTHPVFLCVEGRPCLVAGGDPTAARRARALRVAGAAVTVIAERLSSEMTALVAGGGVAHVARAARPEDVAGFFVAYVFDADDGVAAAFAAAATAARVLLNVHDRPRYCSFHEPAVVDRGALKIAVATSGASPGLAAAVRTELEGRIGPEYRPFTGILAAVRCRPRGREMVEALRRSPLLDLIRDGSHGEIDRLLAAVVGEGCNLDALGVHLEEGGSWS